MKKHQITFITLACVCLAFALPQIAKSDTNPICLQASIYNPTGQNGGNPKSPILIPSVSLDDHTLYFDTPCDGCTLNIVDGNNIVVYTLVIPTGTTSLVLPATLSGEYELQIIRGNYLFYGTIDLP
ncbi:MAG: hypothetical protein IJK42_10075 [Prevotella sp.]|nr:hypothetical protein [Prevotella sp.]MBQ6210102.1 hypothetical protein [Prevotella sp.]